jgi:hypothetical protein
MISKEQILKMNDSPDYVIQRLILHVLLDIREQLENNKNHES